MAELHAFLTDQDGGFTSAGAKQTPHWRSDPKAKVVRLPSERQSTGPAQTPAQMFAQAGGQAFVNAVLGAKQSLGRGPSIAEQTELHALLAEGDSLPVEGKKYLIALQSRIADAQRRSDMADRIGSALATGDADALKQLLWRDPKVRPYLERL